MASVVCFPSTPPQYYYYADADAANSHEVSCSKIITRSRRRRRSSGSIIMGNAHRSCQSIIFRTELQLSYAYKTSVAETWTRDEDEEQEKCGDGDSFKDNTAASTFTLGIPASASASAAALITCPAPALALTKYTEEEWVRIGIASGIVFFTYIIVMPLIIYNYLRLRWFKRKLPEAIFQFLLVFLFFPGLLLLAPFINFRPFPKDPSMKEPWS